MIKSQTNKKFDLEDRTLNFALKIREFIKTIPSSSFNVEYSKQLIRSSASVGANYIEANESIGKKDLLTRLKISRKRLERVSIG